MSGIPIVLLHAFPLSHKMWEPNRAALSKNFRLITPDFPGFGDAPVHGDTTTMETMARHVLSKLDALGINEKFIVCGLSMGGYALFHLLRLGHERIRAACFVSTRAGADSEEGREKRFKNIEFLQLNGVSKFAERQLPALLGKTTTETKPEVVAHVKALIEENKPPGISAALRGMAARPDATQVLKGLSVPALFLAGEEDSIIPPAEMEAMSKSINKADYRLIPKAGHLLNLEQPEAFQDELLHFLKRRVL